MIPRKYRKRPVVVEARQLMGGEHELYDVATWVASEWPWLVGDATKPEELESRNGVYIDPADGCLVIRTLEGDMKASFGDFIIRGVHGEFYPCKPEIFAATYEEVYE
mgnify:CR=1 FL=1